MWTDFATRFGSEVRVRFNWRRFGAEGWPISIERLMPDQLCRVYTPWYESNGRIGAAYYELDARPLSVVEAARRRLEFDAKRAADIQEKVDLIASSDISLEVPAFALPGGRFLLLDGNHRIVALVASGHDAPVTLHAVTGPIESDALPDLARWIDRD